MGSSATWRVNDRVKVVHKREGYASLYGRVGTIRRFSGMKPMVEFSDGHIFTVPHELLRNVPRR